MTIVRGLNKKNKLVHLCAKIVPQNDQIISQKFAETLY